MNSEKNSMSFLRIFLTKLISLLLDGFGGASEDEEEEVDVKPNITHHQTHPHDSSTPTSPMSAPSQGLQGLASPALNTSASPGAAPGMGSLLGRPITPLGVRPSTPTSSTGTPLHEPMSVGDTKVNTAFTAFSVSSFFINLFSLKIILLITNVL